MICYLGTVPRRENSSIFPSRDGTDLVISALQNGLMSGTGWIIQVHNVG